MATIRLEYIFIAKAEHDSKSLGKIIEEIMDSVVLSRDANEKVIKMKSDGSDEGIQYTLTSNSNLDRCYLKLMPINLRINKAVEHLQIIDRALKTSNQQKYFYYIKVYDGVSEYYSNRLYPKYAQYERLLRQFIWTILTEAYGSSWYKETISIDLNNRVKEIAKKNITMSTVFENMTLDMLRSYLFDKQEVDFQKILEEKFWAVDLSQISHIEICKNIQQMKPTSLWERQFSDYGDETKWSTNIISVHETRNSVAHHKTISEEEFKDTLQKLNRLIGDLKCVIDQVQNKQYTEREKVDIRMSFTKLVDGVQEAIDRALSPTLARVSKMLTQSTAAITDNIPQSSIVKSLNNIYSAYLSEISNQNWQIQESISAVANISTAFKDAILSPQKMWGETLNEDHCKDAEDNKGEDKDDDKDENNAG